MLKPGNVNSVESDQLASEKPFDQELHCFPIPHANDWTHTS